MPDMNIKKQLDDVDKKYKWALKKMRDKDNVINRQRLEIRRLKEIVAHVKGFEV
ncbi:hypothetical protein [uncultured Desulfobacter sp.]|uniref:hypothetical protein n=1 Tax=uncultured Desulfobacter sp. TaxID=240139 RepID=UPI0029F53E1C|nr:hypothetical protein [uncultured Desulfobacter sp.]